MVVDRLKSGYFFERNSGTEPYDFVLFSGTAGWIWMKYG